MRLTTLLTLAAVGCAADQPVPTVPTDDFWWGVATAPYQVEDLGDDTFETDWDLYAKEGRIPESRGAGGGSWTRFDRDLAALEDLGVSHYRFGIEWARIEPSPGEYDHEALREYARRAAVLRGAGIEPVVCLWHFTFPDWATDLDDPDHHGWTHPATEERWPGYVTVVADALGPHVQWWAPQNEPNAQAMAGWFIGMWPPGVEGDLSGFEAQTAASAEAFVEAAQILRERDQDARVLTVQNWIDFAPEPWDAAGVFTRVADRYNHGHLDAVAHSADWIGFNYYHRRAASPFPVRAETHPRGIRTAIETLAARYGKPVAITENGMGTDDDPTRTAYLRAHLRQVELARDDGYDVRGYFAWSLLDNFEWALGWDVRYGLYELDRESGTLTAKPSARWFADQISSPSP